MNRWEDIMKSYLEMTREELLAEKNELEKEFQNIKALSLI